MREFVEHIASQVESQPDKRFMLGLVGAPGSGKSTLASHLVSELNAYFEEPTAVVVPMDGYHFSNAILEQRNLRALKGIPETFDAHSFLNLLAELRQTPAIEVRCSSFDRSLDEPSPAAITVEPQRKIIVIEGNYLLLQQEPWQQIAGLLDETWYLDVPTEILLPRLIERHVVGGRSPEGALEKVEGTDLPNGRLIEASRCRATRILKLGDDGFFVLDLSSSL